MCMFDAGVLDRFIRNEAARVQYMREEKEEQDEVEYVAVGSPSTNSHRALVDLVRRLSDHELQALLAALYDELNRRGHNSPPAPCPA